MKKIKIIVNDAVSRRIEHAAKIEKLSAGDFIIEAVKEKVVQKSVKTR